MYYSGYIINLFKFNLQEWGENCPLFDSAYKLQHDMTFTPLDKIDRRANDEEIIDKILKINSNQLSLGFQ